MSEGIALPACINCGRLVFQHNSHMLVHAMSLNPYCYPGVNDALLAKLHGFGNDLNTNPP